MACGCEHAVLYDGKRAAAEGSEEAEAGQVPVLKVSSREAQLDADITLQLDAEAGHCVTLEKYMGYTSCLDMPEGELAACVEQVFACLLYTSRCV